MSGGAGIGGTRSRGRRSAEQVPTLWVRPLSRPWRVVRRPMRVTGGHIPRGAPVPPLDAPVCGDATVQPIKGALSCRSMRATGGQIPKGRLTRWSRGPKCVWGCDPSQTQRIAAHDRLRGQIPENHRGPSSALRRSSSAPRRAPFMGMRPARRSVEQGPACGMRPQRRAEARGLKPARTARSRVAPTPKGAGTAPPSAGQDAGPPTWGRVDSAEMAEAAV
jgi:hypothetical protein